MMRKNDARVPHADYRLGARATFAAMVRAPRTHTKHCGGPR
jgi:hypothetical protein